jgi:hypothetical protein
MEPETVIDEVNQSSEVHPAVQYDCPHPYPSFGYEVGLGVLAGFACVTVRAPPAPVLIHVSAPLP